MTTHRIVDTGGMEIIDLNGEIEQSREWTIIGMPP